MSPFLEGRVAPVRARRAGGRAGEARRGLAQRTVVVLVRRVEVPHAADPDPVQARRAELQSLGLGVPAPGQRAEHDRPGARPVGRFEDLLPVAAVVGRRCVVRFEPDDVVAVHPADPAPQPADPRVSDCSTRPRLRRALREQLAVEAEPGVELVPVTARALAHDHDAVFGPVLILGERSKQHPHSSADRASSCAHANAQP